MSSRSNDRETPVAQDAGREPAVTTAGVVLVTGAGGGIGTAVVDDLERAGYIVVATDVDAPARDGARIFTRSLRVDDSDDVDSTFAFIERLCTDEGVQLHGVVNVAGVLRSGRVAETSEDDWKALFAVNAFGVFLVSKAAVTLMRTQKPADPRNRRGIVTVASNSGSVPRASMAAYAASKAAAAHFTKSLGLEAAEYGVRCNVVAPGTTRTRMVTDGWADPTGEDAVVAGVPEDFKTGIPLRRIADPCEIAGVVTFLLGESSKHMTMQELVVDGGAAQR